MIHIRQSSHVAVGRVIMNGVAVNAIMIDDIIVDEARATDIMGCIERVGTMSASDLSVRYLNTEKGMKHLLRDVFITLIDKIWDGVGGHVRDGVHVN